MSGTGQKQFLASLRFFGLIDENGVPQQIYKDFISEEEDAARKTIIRDLVELKYQSQIPLLKTGTPKQLKDSFGDRLQGATLSSAVRFLLAAARDVGIEVNPHHKSATRTPRGPRSSTSKKKRVDPAANTDKDPSETAANQSLEMALLGKFPEFDPAWEPEQQKQWFEAYRQLLGMQSSKGAE